MKDQHAREFEQFKTVLESHKATRIQDRLAVLDAFLATEEHVTLSELQALTAGRTPGLDREFLEETMRMFCHFGFAKRRSFDHQEIQYEHLHLGTHHDHFICTRCGRIQEFHNRELEDLQVRISRGFGFHPLQHRMEIYGLCGKCMEQREPTIPLVFAAAGERVRIVKIAGGREIESRLSAMGLHANSTIQVIHKDAPGPFIVAAKDTRLALGHGLAQKIMVAHVCNHDEQENTSSNHSH